MEAYVVGRQFKFKATQPNSLTDTLGSMEFEVQITRVLRVGPNRRSQVVAVRLINATDAMSPDEYVAKCFDPKFSPIVDPN